MSDDLSDGQVDPHMVVLVGLHLTAGGRVALIKGPSSGSIEFFEILFWFLNCFKR